jgi:hypothetical protein
VTGRIDQVDDVVAPLEGDAGGIDGDAALLFLGIKVGGRRSLVDVPHAMNRAGIVQHPLGDRRLTGVDVGNDSDVAEGS